MEKIVSVIAVVMAIAAMCLTGVMVHYAVHPEELLYNELGVENEYELMKEEFEKLEGVTNVSYIVYDDGMVDYVIERYDDYHVMRIDEDHDMFLIDGNDFIPIV